MGQAIARPPPAPVEDFSRQLGQLNDMGFMDRNENLTALRATGGDFEQTLEFIIARRESIVIFFVFVYGDIDRENNNSFLFEYRPVVFIIDTVYHCLGMLFKPAPDVQ